MASRAHSGCAGKENDPIIDLNIKQRAATARGGEGGHTADGGGGNGHNYVAGHKWRVLFIAIVCQLVNTPNSNWQNVMNEHVSCIHLYSLLCPCGDTEMMSIQEYNIRTRYVSVT